MIYMKVIVVFVHCFMMVRYVHSSIRRYHSLSRSTYYDEENSIYNDYDYDAEDDPGPDSRRVSLEQLIKIIRESENVQQYPTEEIRAALNRNDELRTLFQSVEENFNGGLNHSNFGTPCNVTYQYSQPLQLFDEDGIQRFIINQDEYTQRIVHGFCDESIACDIPRGVFSGYKSTCTQNYMRMPLLTYGEGKIEFSHFTIDCGCSCTKMKEKEFSAKSTE